MQDLGREEDVSSLLTSCATFVRASEMSEVVTSPHCSEGNISAAHSTETKLLCPMLLRKEKATHVTSRGWSCWRTVGGAGSSSFVKTLFLLSVCYFSATAWQVFYKFPRCLLAFIPGHIVCPYMPILSRDIFVLFFLIICCFVRVSFPFDLVIRVPRMVHAQVAPVVYSAAPA